MKPHLTYRQWKARRTLAGLIERYLIEMNGTATTPGVKPVGASMVYTLRRVARDPIGQIDAEALKKGDFVDFARRLKARGLHQATAMQYMAYATGVLKYAGSAPGAEWADCENVSAAAVEAAKPYLTKHGLIGKSEPRTRRPTLEEVERLCAYFEEQNHHGRTKIDMVLLSLWQFYSARRVGESCKLLWADWNRDAQTIVVRGMKDPRRKGKVKVVALPEEAQQLLIALYEVRDPAQPRIFPWNSKSASARYTLAKHALGIDGLRLHDSRRDRGTRLVEDKGFSSAEAICFTGHETPAVFERTYLRMNPEMLKHGPLAKRMAQGAEVVAR